MVRGIGDRNMAVAQWLSGEMIRLYYEEDGP